MDDQEHLNIDFLRERRVCATGRLVSMTQSELADLVHECGGQFVRTPPRSSFLMLVGDDGWPTESDGAVGKVFDRARRLKAYGYSVEFIGESEFLERLGLDRWANGVRGPHTLSDLSAILKIPLPRLRRWHRAGLIEPISTRFSLAYFDFRQIALVKQVQKLIEIGALLSDIRRGIEQTRDLLPAGSSLDELLTHIERDGRVLMRLNERIVDHTGQGYFEFERVEGERAVVYAEATKSGVHDLCDEALALEEEGRLDEAMQTYCRALELQPEHPTLHFDLGNTQFQLGLHDEAVRSFRRATDLDCDFAMAWHNLGSVYAQQGAWDAAATSLRRALELVPEYSDSHLTLAQVLRIQGNHKAADEHERASQLHSKTISLLAKRSHGLRVISEDCTGA